MPRQRRIPGATCALCGQELPKPKTAEQEASEDRTAAAVRRVREAARASAELGRTALEDDREGGPVAAMEKRRQG